MAQQVLVQLVDDLDGTSSDDVATVQFGLDGVAYEIDLSEDNAERLRTTLIEFVDSARRVGGRLKRAKTGSAGTNSSSEAGKVREWALENGYPLSNRGRIPSHVVEAYEQAQADAKKASAQSSRRGRARTKRS